MVASVQAYHEAMRLAESRLRVPDPEIKQGAPEWIAVSVGKQTYEQPWAQNGSYAVVYRYRTQSGERKALRCYRVAMKEEIKERYARLAEYFQSHLPGISAGFHFYEEGILVEDRGQLVVRQVVVMDWIEGQTLLTWLDALCRARDREGIGALTRRWEALVEVLRRAHVAHGDLSGSNILVREDGRLILVDYDGVYIPEFAGKAALVSGVPDYQHPQRQDRPFNELMDAFSLAVIGTALRALSVNPSLWERYAPHSVNGTLKEDRLLFSVRDFEDPDASPLFRELEGTHDPLLYARVSQLKEACRQPIAELLPPPSAEALARALALACPDASGQALNALQKATITQVGKLEQLRDALTHGLMRESLQLAEVLEANSPLLDEDLREGIRQMKQRWLERLSPQIAGQVHSRTGDVCIRWTWPEDGLVRHAVVAWRSDRWPQSATEAGTYLYAPVERGPETYGQFQFHIDRKAHVYIQVYYAIPDRAVGERRPTWLYSRGGGQESRYQVGRHPARV